MGSPSVGVPLSSIFPPCAIDPGAPIPTPSFALLGPLPPTTPLHLALNYLTLSDLPEHTCDKGPSTTTEGTAHGPRHSGRGRVLLVTGQRSVWTEEIMEEDEDWMRVHGGDYDVIDKLKRVDLRACPTPDHLKLLLALLGTTASSEKNNVVHMESAPGLVVFWDLGRMFMEQREDEENVPPGSEAQNYVGEWAFKPGVSLSDYMEILSSIKATQDHLSSMRTTPHSTQLILLEPHFDHLTSLPILKPAAELRNGLATPTREKRVALKTGIEWIFGDIVGLIRREDGDDKDEARYSVSLPGDPDVYRAERRPCPRDELANPRHSTDLSDENANMGWRWQWAV